MRIILSPAKKMNDNPEVGEVLGLPVFLEQTEAICNWLKGKTSEELQALWKCNDKIAKQNVNRLKKMDLEKNLTPAILSYEGIAYQYMAAAVFEDGHLDYVQDHLRILSAFYGALKPLDGVTPYRLEMQAKAAIGDYKNLYDLWGKRLYEEVRDEDGIIINLASKEYSKCIEKYLTDEDRFITCTFCEEVKEKMVQKATYAKMARGEMVRYMAEYNIEKPEDMKKFDCLGYRFREDLSTETEYVFERREDWEKDYVWYACYGSNINKTRFMRYINNCEDTTEPTEAKPFTFPYDMYFAASSQIWEGKGVAFVDDTKPGMAYGKIYKITREQFDTVKKAEGSKYTKLLELGEVDGLPVYSFTCEVQYEERVEPSEAYFNTILAGLVEVYGEISEEELSEYLKKGYL